MTEELNNGKSAPKADDRVSLVQMAAYGSGAFANNLLADAIGRMNVILNIGLGMSPALAGLLGALPRLMDALTDPLMGYISDNTKSKWGRRRPYIFVGALLAGLTFMLLWQMPAGKSEDFYFWYFLIGSLVFYLAYTVFATPWVALGYELTPDYDERSKLMGVQNFIAQLAYLLTPWLVSIAVTKEYFETSLEGASVVAMGVGALVMFLGIVPALVLRERLGSIPGATGTGLDRPPRVRPVSMTAAAREFFAEFYESVRFTPFLKICLATFLVFNGFIMISAFQFYVVTYYIYAGDTEAGAWMVGLLGTITTVSTFIIIPFITWMSMKLGKRRAFAISTSLAIFGYCLKWVCYTPDMPYLSIVPTPFLAFGLGGLFTLMPSMMADVVDWDELNTGKRREGMYGSIFWWVVKLGQAVALAAGGYLLVATGFDVELGGNQSDNTLYLLRIFDAFLPAVTYVVAIWAIASFGLTREKAKEIRAELENRRGVVAPAE